MIKVSSIKQYMYCPMKLYNETHVDMRESDDYQLAVEIKKLKIDISDLIQKNMRKVQRNMTVTEIENILADNIDPYIEGTTKSIKSMNLGLENSQINEMIDNAYFKIKTTALKLKQVMSILNRDAHEIIDLFYPNCMYSFLIKDKTIDLIGVCDKIEIVDGKYYPVVLKSGNPPLKGVWDQDAIELASYAVLIEEEFEKDVYVGFVDYEKINDRRPVVMDINLRKEFFDIVRDVKEIVENKKKPKVSKNDKKCEKCEYNDLCLN